MTATFADSSANAMCDTLTGLVTHISLHSADPGTTGASELTNLGYARQAITFNAAADQAVTNDGVIEFGPAGEEWDEATYFGLWNAASTGTFIAAAALNTPLTVPALGTLSFSDQTLVLSLAALS